MDNLEAVSDYFKLAVINLFKIPPVTTHHDGRFVAFFPKDKIEKILLAYDTGTLTVVARDYVASIERVKDRIFESERAMRAKNGLSHEKNSEIN